MMTSVLPTKKKEDVNRHLGQKLSFDSKKVLPEG